MLDLLLQNVAADAINTVVNRDPSWDKKIISFLIQLGFLVSFIWGLINYIRYKRSPEGKNKGFKEILTTDFYQTLNIVLMVSSGLEIGGLIILALDRNVNIVAAVTRFGLLGFFEGASAFFAMDRIGAIFADGVFHVSLKNIFSKKIKDEAKVLKNDLINVLAASASFLISFTCTTTIFFLYMESEGAARLLSGADGVPILVFVSNIGLEFGIILTIFCTPVIVVVNAYTQWRQGSKKRKWPVQKPNPFANPSYKPDPDDVDREKELEKLIASASGVAKSMYERELALLQGK